MFFSPYIFLEHLRTESTELNVDDKLRKERLSSKSSQKFSKRVMNDCHIMAHIFFVMKIIEETTYQFQIAKH